MDLEIRRLTENLINVLNESQIPIEVKRFVVKDIYQMVEARAEEIIKQERAEEKKAEAEKSKGEAE